MKKDFNRLVKELDEDELRDELRMLYDRFPILKEYYKMELGASTQPVLDKYKKDLRRTFFAARRRVSRRARSESKKVIKAFAAISIHDRDLLELIFYRAELMAEAIAHYGITNESFIVAAVKAYEEGLQFAEREVFLDTHREQIEALARYFEENVHYGSYSLWPSFRKYYED
ncbi:DUF6155 family protein [Lewinella sp. 4G2]|uniref:DUF6155 family protein n=1 Tax=Lewinella sp. 4G2 TaxID=1803372 RepID=UPI0007B488F6|nr:DUF6155 family protein [Lewinella sp. 4G2]OAV43066.1 hypothetical protein A3850_000480 [Lewinella sp. 4G2]